MISITIEGTARPQGSKRHVGGGRMIESSKHVAAWREWVRLKASQAMTESREEILSGPLAISILFLFDRPKKHSTTKGLRPEAPNYHTSKPDVDKLLRAVLDAMTGVVFTDDSQVASVSCLKKYGRAAMTEIEITKCGEVF